MILAVKRLRTIGWIALIFVVAIGLYPLSLSVAALRSDLNRVERDIVATKSQIRYLETEFATRASLQQLETWNDLEYGYVAPSASQYLDGERDLADLGGRRTPGEPVRVAAMTLDGQVTEPAGSIGPAFARAVLRPARGEAEAPVGEAARVQTASIRTDSGSASGPALARASRNDEVASAPMKPIRTAQMLDSKLIDRLALQATVENLRTAVE